MPNKLTIVGLGEALFDLFPNRQILGGAPLNVAYHAHQIASRHARGIGKGIACSRIGADALGKQLLAQVAALGMPTDSLQIDPVRPTGTVHVTLDSQGKPSYEIVKNVAWDALEFDASLQSLATSCSAVCFGSLVQRSAVSRAAVHQFLKAAPDAIRMFDVNLRQNYFDQSVLHASFEASNAVKLNDEELPVVASLLGVSGQTGEGDALADARVRALMKRYPNLRAFALTRGARGTLLFTGTQRIDGAPVSYPIAPNADSVGAGDACSAGLLLAMLLRWPPERTVALANHLGAFVASQPGATPTLPEAVLKLVDG